MTRYLIDSDMAIDVLNGHQPSVDILTRVASSGVALSILSYGEMYQGAYYGRNPEQNIAGLQSFLLGKIIIPPTQEIMERYGVVRGLLPRQLQRQIGAIDFIIACTAIEYDLTLLTRNIKDFQHIQGVRIYADDTGD